MKINSIENKDLKNEKKSWRKPTITRIGLEKTEFVSTFDFGPAGSIDK